MRKNKLNFYFTMIDKLKGKKMKKKRTIIILTLIICIVLVSFYIFIKKESFSVNFHVINNTNKNQKINMKVLLVLENTSTSENIINFSMIESDYNNKKETTINTPKGDYGLVLNIDESTSSLYFPVGTLLSYVNYTVVINDSSDNNIILEGDITSKELLGTKTTQKIKPIIINVPVTYGDLNPAETALVSANLIIP